MKSATFFAAKITNILEKFIVFQSYTKIDKFFEIKFLSIQTMLINLLTRRPIRCQFNDIPAIFTLIVQG